MTTNYLVFDTETTGLPKRPLNKFYSSFDKKQYYPISDIIASSQSRLVSICWIVHDKNNTIIQSRYYIIKPDGFIIPEESTKIHKISQEYAEKRGVSIKKVFDALHEDIKTYDIKARIAHNFLFDQYILGSEMYRYNQKELLADWEKVGSFCTMGHGMTHFDFGLNRGGYPKPPRLAELYYLITNKKLDNAHNAVADTEACAKCYQYMIDNL